MDKAHCKRFCLSIWKAHKDSVEAWFWISVIIFLIFGVPFVVQLIVGIWKSVEYEFFFVWWILIAGCTMLILGFMGYLGHHWVSTDEKDPFNDKPNP